MICLDEGILRAYLDKELTQYEMLSVNHHLELCDDCRRRHETIATRTQSLHSLFDDVSPLPHELRTDSAATQWAFTRFKANYDVTFDSVAAPAAREFQFLIPDAGLWQCLQRGCQANWQDFKRDPQAFLHYLWHGEQINPMRRRRLQTGTVAAMASYVLLFTTLIIAGVFRTPPRAPEIQPEEFTIVHLASPPPAKSKPLTPPEYANAGKNGLSSGNKIQFDPAHGGGSGGNLEPVDASRGRVPQLVPNPQIVPPRPQPNAIQRPALVVPETLVGNKYILDARAGRTGIPDAADAAPASGSGKNAGVGTNTGTGLGTGEGKGFGAGQPNNFGNGQSQNGGGLGNDPVNNNVVSGEIFDATNSLKPTILARAKAPYTDEAQQNRVAGTVLVSAVFGANGQVSQVQIIRGLSHGLSESVITAVKKIKFQPAVRNSNLVNVRMTLQYDFNLF